MTRRSSPVAQLLLALAFSLTASSLFAGASNKSGNPFGNGTFFSTTGTFNGVLRGPNIIGITTFSTGTNTTISGGPLYIYNTDTGLYDDSWGVYPILNPSANTLSAFLASSNNSLSGISYTNSSGVVAWTTNFIATPLGGSGSFSATLRTSPPNQVYSGGGTIKLTTNAPLSFSISGVRIGN